MPAAAHIKIMAKDAVFTVKYKPSCECHITRHPLPCTTTLLGPIVTTMPRKRNSNRLKQAYQSDLKKRVVYQVYTLGMSTTECHDLRLKGLLGDQGRGRAARGIL